MSSTNKGNPKQCPLDCAFTSIDGKPVALTCGSWNCETCSKILAREWARIARYGIEHIPGEPYFWTLTMSNRVRTVAYAYEVLPRLWDTFRKKIQRHVDAWLYIAFVEGQPQRGYMPHFHILSSVKSYSRLKDLAVGSGFGYQAKELPIDSAGAEYYVAKYASKQGWQAPPKFRRVRASRTWPRPPDPEKDVYLVRSHMETLYGYVERVARLTYRDVSDVYEDYQLTMGQRVDEATWTAVAKRIDRFDE